ncbi:hypothetical protein ERO13_D04G066575v2 [Gossypium hirsutum]|nr:hypothetical protein ERO13_D04G066575v2 [Gossypium hirsutum]
MTISLLRPSSQISLCFTLPTQNKPPPSPSQHQQKLPAKSRPPILPRFPSRGGEERTIAFMRRLGHANSKTPLLGHNCEKGTIKHPFPMKYFLKPWKLSRWLYQVVKFGIVNIDKHELEVDFKRFWEEFRSSNSEKIFVKIESFLS